MQTVAETPTFTRQCNKLFTAKEKVSVIEFLATYPNAGDVIPGTNGVRKVRIPLTGRGKRGGGRIVYYAFSENAPIYALLAYGKSEKVKLTPDETKAVAAFAAAIKVQYRTGSR